MIILLLFLKDRVNRAIEEEPSCIAIQGVVDQIWDKYDADKDGELNKEETKKFLQGTVGNMGFGDEFSMRTISMNSNDVFATFDKDNSGNVEKNEMASFVKQLLVVAPK